MIMDILGEDQVVKIHQRTVILVVDPIRVKEIPKINCRAATAVTLEMSPATVDPDIKLITFAIGQDDPRDSVLPIILII